MATLLDWGNVDGASARVERNLNLGSRREAFSLLCLASILRIDFDEARNCLTDGSNDRGVDAIYLDERHSRRVIHVFQMKHHSAFSGSNRNFPSSEIDKLLSFITDCFGQVDGFIESCNPLLQQKVLDIWAFVNEGACEVQVHLCSNGQRLLLDQRARFEASLTRFKFIRLNETDLDSLSDNLSQHNAADREIELRVVEEQVYERTDGSVRAVISTVRADEFVKALTDPSRPNQLDPDLFEENVRIYLGEENHINRRILDTAMSDEAAFFWYFNNGITIVCERFSFQPGFANTPIRLLRPQVVNGGQTSHALFQASKADSNALSRIRLLVRIIETQDRSFYAKVAEATNSQTPIRSRDLRSNDPILIRLEASLRAHDWWLDRKRDQYADVSANHRIDALKLGQIWLAYVRGEPEKAKTASDRIFGEFFPLIFDPTEMDADRVISIWRLYLFLEDMKRRQADQARRITRARLADASESPWMVEGLYHLAYATRRLAEERHINIFDFDRVQPLVRDAERRLDRFVNDQSRVSFYRLFRTVQTKLQLFEALSDDQQLSLRL